MSTTKAPTPEPQGSDVPDDVQTSGDNADTPTPDAPSTDELLQQIDDLKAASRRWEARAKSGRDAEKELARLRAAGLTDGERLQAETKRADEAEAKAARLRAGLAHGLTLQDIETFVRGSDDEECDAQARQVKALLARGADVQPKPPQPNPTQGARSDAPTDPAAEYAAWADSRG